jgi:hypothetical protein
VALLLPHLSARRLTPAVLVVAAWFVVALAISAAGVFDQPPDTPPVAIGLAAAVPPLVVIGLLVGSARFRGWVRDLDLRFLTLLQTWRIAGVAFLALLVVGELPARFAVSAGVGDVIVGLTAPVVAVYLVGGGRRARWGYVGWTLFGIADLVAAVSLGVTTGSGMEPLAVLPLSMIPAFGVPLTLALHAISLANAFQGEQFATVRGQSLLDRAGSAR